MNHLSKGEACADVGCHENQPINQCEHVCFTASAYGAKSSLDYYNTITFSTDIGHWREHNQIDLYTIEQVQRQCHEQKGPYYKSPAAPDIPQVTCPVGERCRVTVARIQSTSDPRYYIGCENDEDHLDGCAWQGCRYGVREPIPGSTTHYTFEEICRYCCGSDGCNDVTKCKNDDCDLESDPTSDTNDETRSAVASSLTIWFLMATQLM